MSLLALRFSMLGTLALIIGISTLFFAAIIGYFGPGLDSAAGLISLLSIVVIFNFLQWLVAPYLIGALYRVRDIPESENPRLYSMVRGICARTGIQVPRLMLADIPIPNAFAYGSPIAGNRVAVTSGLLSILEDEEVEAVLGHELGHLKHRDVQVMMFLSVLPSIFYFIGYSLMWSNMLGGRRNQRGGGLPVLIGVASIALYWVLSLFVLKFARLRELYADQHGVQYVPDGARKLSEGLSKIVLATGRFKLRNKETPMNSSFKSLFIADPDRAVGEVSLLQKHGFRSDNELVQAVMSTEMTTGDRILEIFSTHPNIVKRLKALQAPSY